MAITNAALEIKRGDSETFIIQLRDEDEACIDITGWIIFFTVKQNLDQTDNDAKIKKNITIHTDPINGKTEIPISSSDTTNLLGNYIYDIQIKDTGGNIKTILEGIFTVSKDVSRRTS